MTRYTFTDLDEYPLPFPSLPFLRCGLFSFEIGTLRVWID